MSTWYSYERYGPKTSRMSSWAVADVCGFAMPSSPGVEWVLVGMRPGVDGGDVRHRGIGEQHGAVASDEVAAIESLADKERVVIRLVLFGRIELEEPLVVAREDERNTTNVDGAVRTC